jgi:hypothetical protein
MKLNMTKEPAKGNVEETTTTPSAATALKIIKKEVSNVSTYMYHKRYTCCG